MSSITKLGEIAVDLEDLVVQMRAKVHQLHDDLQQAVDNDRAAFQAKSQVGLAGNYASGSEFSAEPEKLNNMRQGGSFEHRDLWADDVRLVEKRPKRPKVFVGMMRIPWGEFITKRDIDGMFNVRCSCGLDLRVRSSIREHWQVGHFDTEVYSE